MSETTLHQWTIRQSEQGLPYLIAGYVSSHPLLGTQLYGHSTSIIWLDLERELAQTLNTLYRLNTPAEDLSAPELKAVIDKLHPENVPPDIRRAFAARKPYPGTSFEDDVVAHWNIERWTGLKKGVDYLVEDTSSADKTKS